MKDLSVYINFPFCRQKCHFCDWVQRIPKSDLFLKAEDDTRKKYVSALCREIREKGGDLTAKGYQPKVIYWGGGTATSATEAEVDRIVEELKATFDLSNVTEWTIEGSPESVSFTSLKHFRKHGFNRFSCGLQSFNEERLRHLGRRHNKQQGIEAIYLAQEAGFTEISLDLMCGFPDESLEEIKENIQQLKPLPINHLSLYTFRPTKGTVLQKQIHKHAVPLSSVNQVQHYEYARGILNSEGYLEYGVGYFGKVAENVIGMFSLLYDVVGFGSGAVSILEKNYCGHTSGLLHSYIENPMSYDYKTEIIKSPGVLFSLLRSGLSIYTGLKAKHWLERLGQAMDDSFQIEGIKEIIEVFKKVADLKLEKERVYLPAEKAPLALLGLINGAMLASA